jgi:hypothetical protein
MASDASPRLPQPPPDSEDEAQEEQDDSFFEEQGDSFFSDINPSAL